MKGCRCIFKDVAKIDYRMEVTKTMEELVFLLQKNEVLVSISTLTLKLTITIISTVFNHDTSVAILAETLVLAVQKPEMRKNEINENSS